MADANVFAQLAVIAAADSRFIVTEQLAQAGISGQVILEPEGRDSAAAVAVAALHAARINPEQVVLIMAADHVIVDTAAFTAAVRIAARGVRAGYTMTLGVEPTRPATDYGYIRRGSELIEVPEVYAVDRFGEKPDTPHAENLIAEGLYGTRATSYSVPT